MAGSPVPAVVLASCCCLLWTAAHAKFPHRSQDGPLLPGENEFLGEMVDALDDLERSDHTQNQFLSNKFPDFQGGPTVDGGWSEWLPWWPCTQSCGGVSYRFRRCDNPPPRGGGRPCDGNHLEVRPCPPCPTYNDTLLLRDGPKSSAGRVEVFINGRWGTVCDDDFDVNDAKVVCRQLGYDQKTPSVKTMAYYGEGTGRIQMDNVQCNGSETNILDCLHLNSSQHNCFHFEDVGVDCDPSPQPLGYQVRLVDGDIPKRSEGRIEIYEDGMWGTVCDDNFNLSEAVVVCRSLGFNTSSPEVLTGGYYGPGLGHILLDNVRCQGNETNLAQCVSNGLGNHDCSHAEDAGVNCEPTARPTTLSPYQVRLVDRNGRNATAGRVEVYINGRWGTVCDDEFDINDAIIVCRMLGINTSIPIVKESAFYGKGSGLIMLDNLECLGTEKNLQECRSNPPRIHDCLHKEDVGVDCNISTND